MNSCRFAPGFASYLVRCLRHLSKEARVLTLVLALLFFLPQFGKAQSPPSLWSLSLIGYQGGQITAASVVQANGTQLIAVSDMSGVRMVEYPGYNVLWTFPCSAWLESLTPQFVFFSKNGADVWIAYPSRANDSQGGATAYCVTEFNAQTGAIVDYPGTSTPESFLIPVGYANVAIYGNELVAETGRAVYSVYNLGAKPQSPPQSAPQLWSIDAGVPMTLWVGSWNGQDALAASLVNSTTNNIFSLTTGQSLGSISPSQDVTSIVFAGFDPGNGLIVNVGGSYNAPTGTYRFVPDSSGNPTCTSNGGWYQSQYFLFPNNPTGGIVNAFADSLMLGAVGNGIQTVSAFDYLTGNSSWNFSFPNGGYGSLLPGQTLPNGHWLAPAGLDIQNNGNVTVGNYLPTFSDYTITNTGPAGGNPAPNIPQGGVFGLAATAAGVVIGGANNLGNQAGGGTYLGLQNSTTGVTEWSSQSHAGNASPRVSPDGKYIVVCYKGTANDPAFWDTVSVYQVGSSVAVATYSPTSANYSAASFQDAVWVNDTTIVALGGGWNPVEMTFNAAAGTLVIANGGPFQNLASGTTLYCGCAIAWTTTGSGSAATTTHYAVGYDSGLGNLVAIQIDGGSPGNLFQAQPAFNWVGGSEPVYRIVPLSNGNVACLTPGVGSTGWQTLNWTIYSMSTGSLAPTGQQYAWNTPDDPFFGTDGINGNENYFASGDISPDGKVMAFAEGHGVDTSGDSGTGNPLSSQLQLVRASDGALLPSYNESFTGIGIPPANWYDLTPMTFSPDGSILYVADDWGSRIQALPVPNWVTSMSVTPTTPVSGSTVSLTINLARPAAAGETVVVTASPTISDLTAPTTGYKVPTGSSSLTVQFAVPAVSSSTTYTLSAQTSELTNATANPVTFSVKPATTTLTVTPASVATLSLSPTTVVGGSATVVTGTVTLNGLAGPSGNVVNLTSSSSAAAVPASITVPASTDSTTFTFTTNQVTASTTVTISAVGAGSSASPVTATLSIAPYKVQGVAVSPTSITGGATSTGTVTLSQAAGPAGIVVNLASSKADAQVPAMVKVPSNASTTTFNITSNPVAANETIAITGSIGTSSQSANLTLNAPVVTGVSVSPTSVVGGNGATGTVTIGSAAPSAGLVVSLKSSSSSATAPASVTIAGGGTSATFAVTTIGVASSTSVMLTATSGSTSKTCTLTVTPAALTKVQVSPTSVVGGSSTTVTGTITLSGDAGPSGDAVTLTSSNTSAASAPASVSIPANGASGTFSVTTHQVTAATSVTITATFGGVSQTTTLTVNPETISSLTLNPTSVTGGSTSTGTVTIAQTAGSGGIVVNLTSNNAAAQTPATVTVASGQTSATFTATTTPVAAQTTVAISASIGAGTKSANLTIVPPTLTGVSISPNPVVGGNGTTGTITLNGPAPTGGEVVSLASSSADAVVAASVTVAAGSTSATFSVKTVGVTTNTVVTITATLAATSEKGSLTVQPASLTAVQISPTTVVGGSPTSVTGMVTLNGQAGAGGAVVKLASSSTSAATVPASVTVAAGATSATFAVTTKQVSSVTTATITATYSGVSETATLTVDPYQVSTITLSPSQVDGGDTCTGTVTLDAVAPTGGTVVNLNSSSSIVKVPATITVPAGASSVTFSADTSSVASSTSVTVDAWVGSKPTSPPSATVTVDPPTIVAVLFSPDSVSAGSSTTLYVLLSAPAPAGAKLSVSCSSLRLTVGTSLTCVAGELLQSFTLPTTAGPATTVIVEVSYNGTTDGDTLFITP